MKDQDDKHIAHFIDNIMRQAPLESPTFDFTAKVMSQVMVVQKSAITTYQPLITKKVWVFIVAGVMTFIGYILFSQPLTSKWFEALNLKSFNIDFFNIFNGFEPSKTTLYAVTLLAVMVLIQVPLLKHYLNKRFEV